MVVVICLSIGIEVCRESDKCGVFMTGNMCFNCLTIFI